MHTPPRILCIEDNPMNWRLVQRLLGQGGYESLWASEGLKGYDLALETQPDLILLDINLPGLSGFEIATKLRHAKELKDTIIVALTAKTLQADRDTALVTGCDGFISKPIDPFRFLGQVKDYLEGRRDRIDQGREEETLRQFSQQVVEHLEDQLKELQESNRKLLEAQGALELRNRQLSGLLDLSQALLPLHDAEDIQRKALARAASELGLKRIALLRLHESGGYLEGLLWENGAFTVLPPVDADHALLRRIRTAGPAAAPKPEALGRGAAFEEGLSLGFWDLRDAAGLVPLWGRADARQIWGLLAFSRTGGDPILPFEGELMALYGGLLRASLENAALIGHLNESSRALGESFDRLEKAYLELQTAQQALGQTERKALLGDLFLKIAQRIQSPVEDIRINIKNLEAKLPAVGQDGAVRNLDAIHASVGQMDHLMRSMLRRAGQTQATPPEWIDLHDLIYQELELLQAEGTLQAGTRLRLELGSKHPRVYGVYSDFAEAFGHFVAHASAGGASPWIGVRTSDGDGEVILEVSDQGGSVDASALEGAFQPFSGLSLKPAAGGRRPGAGLPAAAQHLAAYGVGLGIESEEEGTRLTLHLPKDEEPRGRSLS